MLNYIFLSATLKFSLFNFRREYAWEFLVGVCRPVLQILTLFQNKKCNFPHPFSDQTSKIHTRFKTWPLGRNYVTITWIRARNLKFFKFISVRIFLFLSYSYGIETINTFIPSVVPSKTIPDSSPKGAKCIPVFRPKRRKNATRWGGPRDIVTDWSLNSVAQWHSVSLYRNRLQPSTTKITIHAN